LHVDLGQWDYVDGEWLAAYARCDPHDPDAVRAEGRAQLDAFRALAGRDPTHVDSHQHVHDSEPAASAIAALADEVGVPLRGRALRYDGSFYGQTGRGEPYPEGITADRLAALIAGLPAGWTELGCHPGEGVGPESSYASERELELRALCHATVATAVR